MAMRKVSIMTNRDSIHATVFDFSRDVYGNRTAHFVIQPSPGGVALHSSSRRQQVGYGDKDLAAVNAFLAKFEGGGWKLAWVHENGPSVVCAGFERASIVCTPTNDDEPHRARQAAPECRSTVGGRP